LKKFKRAEIYDRDDELYDGVKMKYFHHKDGDLTINCSHKKLKNGN